MLEDPWVTVDKGFEVARYNTLDAMWEDAMLDERLGTGERSSRSGSKSFCGTKSIKEAYEMGTFRGWVEGAEKARKLLQDIPSLNKLLSGSRMVKRVRPVGGHVHMQRFVAGDKSHMITRKRMRTSDGTHISIGVESAAICWVTDEQIMNRGAAVTALVQALESKGLSTELSIISTIKGRENDTHVCQVKVKPAGQYLNLERMAMGIGHPSTFRRGVFGIMERHERFSKVFSYGYGSVKVMNKKQAEQIGLDYYVKGIDHDSMDWTANKPKAVTKWITDMYQAVLERKNIKA